MADDDLAHRRALEDEWIAVRCQLGERAAFDELIQRWHGPIWQYVRHLSDDDVAQDIAQDIWLRVLRGIGRLRDPAKLRAWLFGIAHRTWIDTLRKQYAVVVADIGRTRPPKDEQAEDRLLRRRQASGRQRNPFGGTARDLHPCSAGQLPACVLRWSVGLTLG